MNGTTLLLAIIGHLVGDYLLQNDWMALNKKKHSGPCLVHCLIWATCVCQFAGWFNWFAPAVYVHHIDRAALVWSILFVTHFLQDRTNIISWWMDSIGQKQFKKPDELIREKCPPIENGEPLYFLKVGLGPWSVVIVDNVWHIVTLWAVWRLVA